MGLKGAHYTELHCVLFAYFLSNCYFDKYTTHAFTLCQYTRKKYIQVKYKIKHIYH